MKLFTAALIGLDAFTSFMDNYYFVIPLIVIVLLYFFIYKKLPTSRLYYNWLMKNGIKGTATVLSIKSTGLYAYNGFVSKINLLVEIPGRQEYAASTRMVIRTGMKLYNGVKVAVMVSKRNEAKLVIMRHGNLVIGPDASPELSDELTQKLVEIENENSHIRATGTYCKAIITGFSNLKIIVDGDSQFARIEVRVLPENESAFTATTEALIKDTSLAKYQPGQEIFVKYDPNDKSKVAIEHS